MITYIMPYHRGFVFSPGVARNFQCSFKVVIVYIPRKLNQRDAWQLTDLKVYFENDVSIEFIIFYFYLSLLFLKFSIKYK